MPIRGGYYLRQDRVQPRCGAERSHRVQLLDLPATSRSLPPLLPTSSTSSCATTSPSTPSASTSSAISSARPAAARRSPSTGPEGEAMVAVNLRCAENLDLSKVEITRLDGASLWRRRHRWKKEEEIVTTRTIDATTQAEVRARIDDRARAARAKDVDGIMACYAPDTLSFDCHSHVHSRVRRPSGST